MRVLFYFLADCCVRKSLFSQQPHLPVPVAWPQNLHIMITFPPSCCGFCDTGSTSVTTQMQAGTCLISSTACGICPLSCLFCFLRGIFFFIDQEWGFNLLSTGLTFYVLYLGGLGISHLSIYCFCDQREHWRSFSESSPLTQRGRLFRSEHCPLPRHSPRSQGCLQLQLDINL